MELVQLYKKLKQTKPWIKPAQLKNTRTLLYRMTQVEFSQLLDISYHTYVSWEAGKYTPSSPAQALLHIVTFHKKLFLQNKHDIINKFNNTY